MSSSCFNNGSFRMKADAAYSFTNRKDHSNRHIVNGHHRVPAEQGNQSEYYAKAGQDALNGQQRDKLSTRYPLSPVATVAYIRAQLGGQSKEKNKYELENNKQSQCEHEKVCATSESLADEGFISTQTQSFYKSQCGNYVATEMLPSSKRYSYPYVNHTPQGSAAAKAKFSTHISTPTESLSGITKEGHCEQTSYKQTAHLQVKERNPQQYSFSPNKYKNHPVMSTSNQFQIDNSSKRASILKFNEGPKAYQFRHIENMAKVHRGEIVKYETNKFGTNSVLEKNDSRASADSVQKKHSSFVPPHSILKNPIEISMSSKLDISKKSEGKEIQSHVKGESAQNRNDPRLEQTYARLDRNIHFEHGRHQTSTAYALDPRYTRHVRARTSIASSDSEKPSAASSKLFVTSTPLEKLKYFQHTPVSAKSEFSLQPSEANRTEARSEPRYAAAGNLQHINDTTLLERENDKRLMNRDHSKSAPDSRRSVSRQACQRLKPVNLFPEWTHGGQKALTSSQGDAQGLFPQSSRRRDEHFLGDKMNQSCKQGKMHPTTSDFVPSTNREASLPKGQPVVLLNKPGILKDESLKGKRVPMEVKSRGERGWFNENTIRRLSALNPTVFQGRIPQSRHSGLGVIQAKSVDIAAIYSEYQATPKPKPPASRDNGSFFDKQQSDRTAYEALSQPTEIPLASSLRNVQIPTRTSQIEAIKSTSHQPNQIPTERNRKLAPISIMDHGFSDEEFRPAILVLQDLRYSPSNKDTRSASNLAPPVNRSSMARMSMLEGKNSTNNQVSETHRRSLNVAELNLSRTNEEAHNRMTQASIRNYMENNRRRTRLSLPTQPGFLEKQRQNYIATGDNYRKIAPKQLYNITEDVHEPLNHAGSYKYIPQAEASLERECEKRKGKKTNDSVEMRKVKRPTHDEYFKQLDAAMSRRHTIHFGNHSVGYGRQVSRHPSIDTLSSGYRSLERNEQRLAPKTERIPQNRSYPTDQKENKDGQSTKSLHTNKPSHVQNNGSFSTSVSVHDLRLSKRTSPLREERVTNSGPLHKVQRLETGPQSKELSTSNIDTHTNPTSFMGSTYKPVQGPREFLKQETKAIFKDTRLDSVSHHLSPDLRQSRRNPSLSNEMRRQTIGGIQAQRELKGTELPVLLDCVMSNCWWRNRYTTLRQYFCQLHRDSQSEGELFSPGFLGKANAIGQCHAQNRLLKYMTTHSRERSCYSSTLRFGEGMERRQALMASPRLGHPRPSVPLSSSHYQMDKKKGSPNRKRNVFKGSVLVSLLVESHPDKFPTRLAASRLARRLYQDGHIRSIFGASQFEDSAQLYVWNDIHYDARKERGDGGQLGGGRAIMTAPVSSSVSTPALPSSHQEARAYDQSQIAPSVDWQLIQDIKSKVLNRSETYNIVTSYNTFFQELERDFGFDHKKAHTTGNGPDSKPTTTPYTSTLELKKQNSAHKSTDPLAASGTQAEKDRLEKTTNEAAKRGATSPPKRENPKVGKAVPASHKILTSSHVAGKQSPTEQYPTDLPRSVGKNQTAGQQGELSAKVPHPLRETGLAKSSAQPQPQTPVDRSSSPSKASTLYPPSALVKPHQHQKSSNYLYHQYQNQPNLVNTPGISQSTQSSRNQRSAKKTDTMDSNSTGTFVNTRAFPKGFSSVSPESHTPLNSQPSTLESGIGSSHPDSTVNTSSVPPNHQSFSLGTLEHPDPRPQHYDHYSQSKPQHYNGKSYAFPHESQSHYKHQSHSMSPPQISKYPNAMSFNVGGQEHIGAPKRNLPHGASERPGSYFVHRGQGLNDVGGGGRGNTEASGELISGNAGHTNPSRINTTAGVGGERDDNRWATESGVVIDGNNSYSDNEKQLLEEMRRMKQEHQSVLKTYEGRVNKLMAKMHELRSIAEMLENSSSKPLPGKLTLLDILEDKDLPESRLLPASEDNGAIPAPPFNAVADADNGELQQGQTTVPPPLPPRPSRGTRVYPNKPIIHTSAQMRALPWTRIILDDEAGAETPVSTVWHGMREPSLDTEELERLFSGGNDQSSDVNLYDDVCLRRGRAKTQLVSIYESERSQRIVSELRALPCTLPDMIQAFLTLNSSDLQTDSFAELLELLTSARELDKILHHVRRKGAGQLDAPEYLVYELSKVDHFRERLEFLRFKNKLQINLFEIDQQLKELNTACEEITSNLSLKNVLETVLAVGNHMNAGTDRGQADGFRVDILNTLKNIQDTLKKGNLLELILRVYCLKYESALDLGCPTRFQLPEPSNMRHAAQVSFEDIQRALKELKEELAYVRGNLEALSVKEGNTVTIALRVTSENFMTSAMEVLAEEEKLLEATRIQFWKTASFFSQEGQRSSPREFFQVWASFLHDCKYYWKLAHRNLARDRFTADLATKSQLSSSSLPGFNSLKSTMMRHVASFSQDEEMRENRARQLEHINSWIESVGRYTLEMGPEDHEEANFFNEADYQQQHQQSDQYHLHKHQHYPHPHHDGVADNLAFDSPENADDRDCLTPVNLPENDLQSNQYGYYQHRQQIADSKYQRNEGLDQYGSNIADNDDLSSPYYKNQPRAAQTNKNSTKPQQKYDPSHLQTYKPPKGIASFDQNQMQTSPKPIKAIPPNVIKPQPITQVSPSISSPSPTSPHHHTVHLAKPLTSVDTNNNHNSAKKQNNSKNSSSNTPSNSNRDAKHRAQTEYNRNVERAGFNEEYNFGFEPLYESLSRHALGHPVSPHSDGSETPPPYTESENSQAQNFTQAEPQDYNGAQTVSSPGPIEPDNTQKKNGSFFKSLLKRDSKQRSPPGSGEQQQHQGSNHQHSALRSVSAPFNKFRNTVVQKLSGSSGSKKAHAETEKSPSSIESSNNNWKQEGVVSENVDGLEESPPKPPRGFISDPNSNSQLENKTVNPFHDDVVNYQNYFYPGQPRRADVAASTGREDKGFEEYHSSGRSAGVMLVNPGHRDGHDSLPSTVSSRHSGRDQGLSMFRESNNHELTQSQSHSKDKSKRRDRSRERLDEQSQPSSSSDYHHRHGHKAGPRARSGRDRAPIALGSNVSISDMYGKALEAATQLSEDEAAEEMNISDGDRNEFQKDIQQNAQSHHSEQAVSNKQDFDPAKGISMTAEPKWVKATAVPVYKAKLIPNYENQTKYDPRLEGGIRGHAGPVTTPASTPHIRHDPQSSNSSDMYRKELQKKSGQFVVVGGGVIYQDPSNCSSSKGITSTGSAVICSSSPSAIPGAPTSYTVLPPKFSSSHYHASPLIFSQHPSNSSQLHQPSNHVKNLSEGSNANNAQRSSSSPPPHQTGNGDNAQIESHHIKTVAASMFTVSPDGRLELGPPRDAHSAEGGLFNKKKDEPSNRSVARRSSSANNILDRAHGGTKTSSDGHNRKRYHADDNVYNSRHNENSKNSPQGRMSRKDDSSKKATPTSSRQPAAPQSVMSLIDRFEQTPPPNASPSSNFLHPPLMEDDKPPSMTSTPLARRKNVREDGTMVSPPVSSGRSDDASTHSHSTGSRKSSSYYHGEPHKHHHRHLAKEFDRHDKGKSHRYHKHDDQGGHGHRKYESGHKSNTKRSGSYPEVSHHQNQSNPFPDPHNSLSTPQQQNHQSKSSSSSNSTHHHSRNHPSQHADRKPNDGFMKSSESQQHERGLIHNHNQYGSSQRDGGKEIRASSQGVSIIPDHGWGQGRLDERLTYSSQSHRHGHNQSTPPVSSDVPHVAGAVYHSSFLPKPEPQYPGQQKQQQHQSQNSNSNQKRGGRDHHSSDRNFAQLRHQQGQSSPMGGEKNYQHHLSQFPASSNNINNNVGGEVKNSRSTSHNIHRRPSPQILYISPLAAQQTSNNNSSTNNSQTNNNSNNDKNNPSSIINNNNHLDKDVSGMQTGSTGNDLYTTELRRAIKSSNSAFDRPLKSGPLYGRQPGAMAVVKPTVLHP